MQKIRKYGQLRVAELDTIGSAQQTRASTYLPDDTNSPGRSSKEIISVIYTSADCPGRHRLCFAIQQKNTVPGRGA